MKHLSTEICYMCDEIANTNEHVPPKCIFPESKDSELDLRKNLIKVPSCRKHNNSKSGEDEFLMVFLASYVLNNKIGYQHFKGKVSRSLARSAGKQINELFINKNKIRQIQIDHVNSITVGTPDLTRISKIFETIAYGIYRHHFQQSFIGEIKVYIEILILHDDNQNKFKKFIIEKINEEVDGTEKFGQNPEVFFYQLSCKNDENTLGIRMSFYENFKVSVALRKEPNKFLESFFNAVDKAYITTPNGDIRIK